MGAARIVNADQTNLGNFLGGDSLHDLADLLGRATAHHSSLGAWKELAKLLIAMSLRACPPHNSRDLTQSTSIKKRLVDFTVLRQHPEFSCIWIRAFACAARANARFLIQVLNAPLQEGRPLRRCACRQEPPPARKLNGDLPIWSSRLGISMIHYHRAQSHIEKFQLCPSRPRDIPGRPSSGLPDGLRNVISGIDGHYGHRALRQPWLHLCKRRFNWVVSISSTLMCTA